MHQYFACPIAVPVHEVKQQEQRATASRALPVQADLLDLASLRAALGQAQWDAVLDSAVFHCFVQAEQDVYAANLAHYVGVHPTPPPCETVQLGRHLLVLGATSCY